MKCAACGYEYDCEAQEERRESDGHGGAYTVGPELFVKLHAANKGEFFLRQLGVLGSGRKLYLYVCPACGTVRAE